MEDTARLVIGRDRPAGEDGSHDVRDPWTGRVVGAAPQASTDQVARAAAAARAAQPAWATTSADERAELLQSLGDALERELPRLAPLVQQETGCTTRVAETMQIPVAVDRFRRYAAGAREPTEVPLPPAAMEETPLAPAGLVSALAVRQPVGVVACITPYNFPITNTAGKIAPALAMGNTVVVKPAPQDPLAVLALAELAADVGFPPGVLNVVTGQDPALGAVLVASPDVDMVSFTGSTPVGREVAATAGRDMKRLLLELGGKGNSIVLPGADLDQAVTSTASTWMFHSGQICTAPTRVLVHRSLYDEVVDRLATTAETLAVGDPTDPATVVGPLISAAHRDRVAGFVEEARRDGARVVIGTEAPDHEHVVPPVLVTDVDPGARVACQEVFGPVLTVLPVDDVDHAVALANDTAFALYDYVWARDAATAMAVGRRLDSGAVGLNTVQRNFEAPFGGRKLSGVGRDSGSWALHAYSDLQSLVWTS